ncbi:MAG: S-formylglutathione hydrolase [Proteobacteria bacterium]|nr:MAG: S-formylglutathione hydrolase [Pseudomonadota bacterium]
MLKTFNEHKTFEGLTQFWEHDSATTKTKMKFSCFVPKEKPKGCLVFLSGLTCTEENFIAKAGAQGALARAGLMVIAPDTSPRGLNLPHEHEGYDFGSGAGFYVDATVPGYRDHYRMDTYVTKELHEIIRSKFSIPADRISLTGHSMGGHGALALGLRNPGQYRSLSAFAPIVNPILSPWGQKAFPGYLGEDIGAAKAYDATELVRAGKKHPHEILIDQGTDDEFFKEQLLTANLVQACEKAGQPLRANYREGYDHSYYFISTFIESHVKFHAGAMGI